MRKFLTHTTLILGSFLIALLLAEGISRIFLPIYLGAEMLSLDGKRLDEVGMLVPGLSYRQYGEEYDALTTITPAGYRVPETTSNPDVIFIGDSFTFGLGLSDSENFPSIYCATLQIFCANLAEPGAGTISELDRLQEFLIQKDWQPKQVYLFVMAMTGFMGAGNDLYDNWHQMQSIQNQSRPDVKSEIKTPEDRKGWMEKILSHRTTVRKYSNLARIMIFRFGPGMKASLAPEPDQAFLQESLEITKQQFQRLNTLSQEYGFSYKIFLLHPVQDISRDTAGNTLAALQNISTVSIIPTAQLFEDNPQHYYFSLDGHFNATGSAHLAAFLLEQYSTTTP